MAINVQEYAQEFLSHKSSAMPGLVTELRKRTNTLDEIKKKFNKRPRVIGVDLQFTQDEIDTLRILNSCAVVEWEKQLSMNQDNFSQFATIFREYHAIGNLKFSDPVKLDESTKVAFYENGQIHSPPQAVDLFSFASDIRMIDSFVNGLEKKDEDKKPLVHGQSARDLAHSIARISAKLSPVLRNSQ